MLTYESFTGVNNVLPEQRMGKGDLLRAGNVDIGLTGELSRREGFTSVSERCHKNLHEAAGFKLATVDGVLTALHPDGSHIALDARLGPQRVWYCNLPDGRVTYSNGKVQGITDGRSWADRCIPVPDLLGAVESCFGELHPGAYRYCLSYQRLADRLEGPPTQSAAFSVATGQGLRLDALPQRDGYEINVYLSGQDGEGMYWAGATQTASFEFAGNNAALVLPCRTLEARPFPMGTITAFWRGRVLVADGNVLWASRPMTTHLADWRDFKPLPARITAIVPVEDGVYVGTDQDLVFLAGTEWSQLLYVPTKRGPVVLGSGIEAPGHRIKLGDGTGGGQAMLCIAGGEIVAGFAGGQTSSLTANRYRSKAQEVCATFRDLGSGAPQYLAVPQ